MAMKATRTNQNEYTVTNQDGTSLKVSPHGTPGAFSLVSSCRQHCLVALPFLRMRNYHMLGADFDAKASVKSTEADNFITDMLFEFQIKTEGLDDAEREKIIKAAAKKIERLCIVKRSLNKGINTETDISAS